MKQRPYASKIAGTPIASEFDLDNVKYTFSFIPFTKQQLEQQQQQSYNILDRNASTTEIFVPYFHFGGKALNIQVNLGECDYDEEKQTLYHYYDRKSSDNLEGTIIAIQLSCLNAAANGAANNGSCSIM